ncbi:spore germination protein GerW family protein [Halobacterium zhouii]|uniref:spore germination protein GerW family protein n=1 Tax=Halobacterium zhouii TaxID=2902624 RepID=UPI001E5CFF90|nr:spore germination protein GerW family protein [Halobacterium zhouii]
MDEDTSSTFSSIVERLADAGHVDSVYGEPIERGDRTVIPVARVAWGFGGGGGESEREDETAEGEEREQGGSGYGVGGGVSATPVGALELADDDTRFVRYGDRKKFLKAALLAFVVGWLVGRR